MSSGRYGHPRVARLQALLVGVVVLTNNAGCIQQSNSAPRADPREEATKLYETHTTADRAFASLEAPDDCPTHLVSYGTNISPAQVIDFFQSEDLEESDGVANDFGDRPVWTGERLDGRAPAEQVDVWTGPDHGHPEWGTVVTVATARCELTASARYSVMPRRSTTGLELKATLRNTGDLVIEYGSDYEIHRRARGRWHEVPFGKKDGIGCAFPAIGLVLNPGASDMHAVSFCDEQRAFKQGFYRVVKTVSFETYKEETLRARFTVRS